MAVDAWMPTWDVRSAHQIDIAASPPLVYQSLLESNFSRNPVVRVLMGLRAIPGLLFSPRKTWQRFQTASTDKTPTLAETFTPLELRPAQEIVLGLTGRFWTPKGILVRTSPEQFHDPIPNGMARATWSFHLEAMGEAGTRLRTETRVTCADPGTRRRFRLYWSIIQGGSGLIRRALLWQIKRDSERRASGN